MNSSNQTRRISALRTIGLALCSVGVYALASSGCAARERDDRQSVSEGLRVRPAAQSAEPPRAVDADWPPMPRLTAPRTADPGATPPSVTVSQAGEPGVWRVTFHYSPDREINAVALVGTFNSWNQQENIMRDDDADGVYTATVQLPSGRYEYKYLINNTDWIADPRNDDRAPEDYGGFNSVLRLGEVAQLRSSPARTGDGEIAALGIEHRTSIPRYFQPLDRDTALVRVRTLAHDVEDVTVAVKGGAAHHAHRVLSDELFELWETRIHLPQPQSPTTYTFIFEDGGSRRADVRDYKVNYTMADVFHTPDWAKNAIWYQLMVERFRNGDPSNDPEPTRPWTSEWFTPSAWEKAGDQTFYKWYVFNRYYGGDIQGLREKLPYLKDLGVNAIYLNPIFKAESHHKYNATNYLHVDDHYGVKGDYEKVARTEDLNDPGTWKWTESDRIFLDFLDQAHAMGFKVILDGVFNHVGVAHPAFQDVKNRGQDSPYADWFEIESWEPFKYRGWAGFDALPEFRKSENGLASEEAKRHIFNVTRRWMDPDGDGDPSDGIDGWRLDVPNEIPMGFWTEWRDVVKDVNPEAYITGEIWQRADKWLTGETFDAVMNYKFAESVIAWIGHVEDKITPGQFDAQLRSLRLAYPAEANYVMQNLVDSHDTDRVASMLMNPDRPYDKLNRVQDDNPDYNNDKPTPEAYAKQRLIALIQMTYVGAPMIYYGDEVGMWGADDPTNRKPMLWKDLEPYEVPEENHVEQEHLRRYRQMIHLRNRHPALRTGEYQTVLTDNPKDVWAFMRFNDQQQLIVIANAAHEDREVEFDLPENAARRWRNAYTLNGPEQHTLREAQGGRLQVQVPAIGGVVLHAR